MTFEAELLNSEFQVNVIITLAGQDYARYQPDSGLIIPGENLLVGAVKVPASRVDLRNVKTTLSSNTFTLLDKDAIVSLRLGASKSKLLNLEARIRIGFMTGSFDIADYIDISKGKTVSITRVQNEYRFSAKEATSILNQEIYNKFDSLFSNLAQGATSEMILNDVTNFDDSGTVKVDNEIITYSGRDIGLNKLTGLTRGDLSSTDEEHNDGSEVFRVDTITGNPLDLLLQLMISSGGGGIYDVLSDGVGVGESNIDIVGIESIRDANFGSDVYRFYLYDIGDALTFLEEEILLATNCRFTTNNGLISIAILDQTVPGAELPLIDEDTIIGLPRWKVSSNRVVNRITINYNYSTGLGKFTRSAAFDDTDSQDAFNQIKSITYSFKGIEAGLNGANIVNSRANAMLARLSGAQTEISIRTFFKNSLLDVGSKVRFKHRYLLSTSGSSTIDDDMEVISRGYDLNKGVITLKLAYTSVSTLGLRIGLIAPSPLIISVTSQSEFEVPNGSHYGIGYEILINGEQRTITNIVGNIITVGVAFTAISIDDRVKFVDYDLLSQAQKLRYASTGVIGDNFLDGLPPYNISF